MLSFTYLIVNTVTSMLQRVYYHYIYLQRDADDLLPGYLSLHQTAASISLKWTPNQLINSNRLHTHIEEGSSNCTSPTTESR